MEIRLHTFEFDAYKGGLHELQQRFSFSKPVAKAGAVLRGYNVRFVDGDHHFGQLTVQLRSEIVNHSPDGPEVVVYAVLGLRDFSGSWDDRFSGTIDMCLFFETGPDFRPPFDDRPEVQPPIEP